jgi:hypothetical protein
MANEIDRSIEDLPVRHRRPGASKTGRSDDFDLVISRVAQLLDGEDEDESPTTYALDTTLRLLHDTRALLDGPFPRAAATTSVDHGVKLYWEHGSRFVEASIPDAEGKPGFIYHDDGPSYQAERDTTPAALAHWLRWLTDR